MAVNEKKILVFGKNVVNDVWRKELASEGVSLSTAYKNTESDIADYTLSEALNVAYEGNCDLVVLHSLVENDGTIGTIPAYTRDKSLQVATSQHISDILGATLPEDIGMIVYNGFLPNVQANNQVHERHGVDFVISHPEYTKDPINPVVDVFKTYLG